MGVTLLPRAFSTYDAKAHDWVVRPGAYRLMVGASSADIRLTALPADRRTPDDA